jgi:hypothetical protein
MGSSWRGLCPALDCVDDNEDDEKKDVTRRNPNCIS